MATIRRRRTKRYGVRWQAIVRLRNHPPICQTFRLKGDALEWANSVEADLKRGYLQESLEAERHTFDEAITEYTRDWLPQLTARQQWRQAAMLEFWRSQFPGFTLAAITPQKINDVRRGLARGRTGATVNRYVTALRAVFRYCDQERHWIKTNPAAGLPQLRESSGRSRYLSDQERADLLEACRQLPNRILYPLVVTALTTGARQGELMAMRWRDVDLARGRAYLYQTKNRESRAVGLYGECLQLLTAMKATPHFSGYIFAGARTRRKAPRFPNTQWRQARAASGIEDFRFHDLRHTAASYLAMSGATLHEIAAFLGHKSLANVQRYAHLTEEHQVAVSELMVERFLS